MRRMRSERALTPGQWAQLECVFHEVIDLPPEAREALIVQRCGGERVVEDELRRILLARDEAPQGASTFGLAAGSRHAAHGNLTGRLFGDYRLKHRLASGGQGVVYLAERAGVGGEVAVKVHLHEESSGSFFAEQRLHAQLVHPGIPQFHSSGKTEDGIDYFVLEYVAGVPITEHCKQHASALHDRLMLFRAVCEAVQYAHRERVIHCDIKPSNILVKSSDRSIRLLDFGVAAPLPGPATSSTAEPSPAPQPTGLTPAYAAPEQHRREAVKLYTDVHALGMVLYELLALRHPYVHPSESAPSRAEWARRICETEPAALSSAAKEMAAERVLGRVHEHAWSDLDALVGKTLAKDPERRYPSVEALLAELQRFLASEPLLARANAGFAYRTGKSLRRHRRVLTVSASIASALVGLTAWYVTDLAAARDAAAAEAGRAARVQRFMTGLMSGGPNAEGLRDGMRVETLLEQAVAATPALAHDPALEAELLFHVGSSYVALGKLEPAGPLLQRALKMHERTLGGSSPEVAHDLWGLGKLRLALGDLAGAERHARQAIDVGERAAAYDLGFRAAAATLLGDVLNTAGRYPEAIETLTRAADELAKLAGPTHAGKAGPPDETSGLLSALAMAHYYQGNYDDSTRYTEQSLALDRQRLGDQHPDIADGLINLAAVATDQGRFSEAERLNRQALSIFEAFHGAEHPKTASAVTIWARSLNHLERYDEAERALQRAVAVNERLYPQVHPKVASTLHELYVIAYMRNQLDVARHYATRVLEIERALHGNQHARVGHALDTVASVQLDEGNYADAERLFREALDIYRAKLTPGHLSIAIAHLKIGRALLRAKQPAQALSSSRLGYDMLAQKTPKPLSWMIPAARDLIAIYDALGQGAEARRFQALLAAHEATRAAQ